MNEGFLRSSTTICITLFATKKKKKKRELFRLVMYILLNYFSVTCKETSAKSFNRFSFFFPFSGGRGKSRTKQKKKKILTISSALVG